MNKQEKAEEIASLNEAFKGGPSTFVLTYRGLTVNQVVIRTSFGSKDPSPMSR